MFRPSRSLTTWLLWLAIALLPVRAWAVAAMPEAMSAAVNGVATPAVTTGLKVAGDLQPAHRAMPCHAAGESAADDAAAPQACSLCGVCHAAFAMLPSVQASVPALPPERPDTAFAPAVEAAALAGPERPPRPVLA